MYNVVHWSNDNPTRYWFSSWVLSIICYFIVLISSAHFHALHDHVARQNSFSATQSLPIIYDAVHCSRADKLMKQNIWDCNVTIAGRGHCNPDMEAAAVACQALPPQAPEGNKFYLLFKELKNTIHYNISTKYDFALPNHCVFRWNL